MTHGASLPPHTCPAALGPHARWYVVHSAPRKETFAAANLAAQGFNPFLPQLTKRVRHARRSRDVLTPLFPRYLFVALDLQRQRWRSVLGTFGVTYLIMAGDRPKPVPEGVVEALAEATRPSGSIDATDLLRIGSDVRFLTGPFADLVGHLIHLDEGGRVDVLLEILGSQRVVRTTAMALMPVLR